MLRTLWRRGEEHRGRRALVRQREYQERKARAIRPYLDRHTGALRERSRLLRARLERYGAIDLDAPTLEVGSGAHGLVFFLGQRRAVGVDPLARDYRRLFPEWQAGASTLAAAGEALPFRDGAFPLVISDNVVDHARDPRQIVTELVRVLAPGGLLYFTVNHHHRLYRLASLLQGAFAAARLPFEVGPFADHTVHLTRGEARALFSGLPLTILAEDDGIAQARQLARQLRRAVDLPKRLFYKNAQLELIARRPLLA
jgi:SAM-dependent methyltransferase